MQHAPKFVKIYDGLFDIFNYASCLDVADEFNVNQITGRGLLNFGHLWGLRGVWGGQTDGLVYSIDLWSDDKVWSGSMKDADAQIYRNFIKMKAYMNGRPYNLKLLKEALDILIDGTPATVWIEEGYMSFIIHITGPSALINMFYNMAQYDPFFLGKPTGISYTWDYTVKQGS